MVLEIGRCPTLCVAYQGTKGHWEALQPATATTPGRQLGVRHTPGGRRPARPGVTSAVGIGDETQHGDTAADGYQASSNVRYKCLQ